MIMCFSSVTFRCSGAGMEQYGEDRVFQGGMMEGKKKQGYWGYEEGHDYNKSGWKDLS